jgi:hypothetical protein
LCFCYPKVPVLSRAKRSKSMAAFIWSDQNFVED